MLDVLLQVCSSTKENPDIVVGPHIHRSQIHHEMSENSEQKTQVHEVRIVTKKHGIVLHLE